MFEMNPWWENRPYERGIKREKYISILKTLLKNKDIVFITGIRRVGKSTILKQMIEFLITQKGINPKHICYLSLDSYAFREASILELVKEFRKINDLKIDRKVYLFFDEVTSKESFNQEFKNLYDLGNSKIFASSSSSSLLIDKRARLTGRSRTILVNPLDFDEFLQFKKYSPKESEKYLLEKYFEKYMEIGGMPEYVLTGDPTYITNLVENIIYKDIISVHGLKNIELVKDIFKLLCERVGKQLSYNKISNILDANKDTVKNIINYFADVFLFYIVEKDSRKINERLKENKKIYTADVGIKNVTTGFRDLGAIYENLVFISIKENKPRYVKSNGVEIDFSYGNTLIEAKYNSKMNQEQHKLFNNYKAKTKIIANGVDFFISKSK